MGQIEVAIRYFGATGATIGLDKPQFVAELERTTMIVQSYQRLDAPPAEAPDDCTSWIVVELLNDTKQGNVRYVEQELSRIINTALNWDRIGPVRQWGDRVNLLAQVYGRTYDMSFTRRFTPEPPRGFTHVRKWVNGRRIQGFNPDGR